MVDIISIIHRILVQWFIAMYIIKIILDAMFQYTLIFDYMFIIRWSCGDDLKLIKKKQMNKLWDTHLYNNIKFLLVSEDYKRLHNI